MPAERIRRADPQQVELVYWLVVGLALVIMFGAAPALPYLDLRRAPSWAQVVLLLAGAQLAYTMWLVTLPDWTTVWTGMLTFALVAALYGMGMTMVAMTPAGKPLLLDLTDVRASAAGWCGANVLLTGLASYACGRISTRWRRREAIAPRTGW